MKKNSAKNKFYDRAVICTIIVTLVFTSLTVSSSFIDDGSQKIGVLFQDANINEKEFQRIISTLNDDVCDDCDDDDDPGLNKRPEAFIFQIEPNPGYEFDVITFEGYGQDTDGTIIGYLWESDIDGTLSSEALFSSSTLSAGTHEITFYVQDDKYAWSDPVNLTLEIAANMAPNAPFIAGNAQGKVGEEISFNLITSDPEGHDVQYQVDWGDGTIEDWGQTYASDEEISMSHQWDQKGSFQVKAKARDVHGSESEWGTLDIQLTRTKGFSSFMDIIQWLVQSYPWLAPFF